MRRGSKKLTECASIIEEWDFDKNRDIDVSTISYGSQKEAWWKCNKGHSYKCRIAHRTIDRVGCPYCAGHKLLVGFNDLLTIHPEICVDWDYNTNHPNTPQSFIAGSGKRASWLCHVCGHKWNATIDSRARGKGCPECAKQRRADTYRKNKIQQNGSLQDKHPELAAQWNVEKNKGLTAKDVCSSSSMNVWWVCEKGHEWRATINNRAQGKGCPYCNCERKTSVPEQIIFYYLSKLFDVKNRHKIGKYEVDIYLTELRIGIEYDGQYWHSFNEKKSIDEEKEKYLTSKNIKLIRVKESDCCEIVNNVIFYQYSYNYQTMRQVVLSIVNMISDLTQTQYGVDVDINRDINSVMKLINLTEKENSLLNKRPEIVQYWDKDKNNFSPDQISYGSQKPIYLRCDNGHFWVDNPNNFCCRPYCRLCRKDNKTNQEAQNNLIVNEL